MVDPENAAKDLEDGKRKSVKGVQVGVSYITATAG